MLSLSRVFTSFLTVIGFSGLFTVPAQGQGLDLGQIRALLATDHSPLLQAVEYQSLETSPSDGGGLRLRLLNLTYAGQDLDSLSFDVQAIDKDRLAISNVELPSTLTFSDGEQTYALGWDGLEIEGVFNTRDGAYEQLMVGAQSMSLVSADASVNVTLGSFSSAQVFDPAEKTLTSQIDGGDLTISIQDHNTLVTGHTPSFFMRGVDTGFTEGENPLSQLRENLNYSLASLRGTTPEQWSESLIIADKSSGTVQIEPLKMTVFDGIDEVSINLGRIVGVISFDQVQTPQEASGHMTLAMQGLDVTHPEIDGALFSIGELATSSIFDQADFSALSPINSTALYSHTPGTYGSLGDMISALGVLESRLSLRDMRYSIPGTGFKGGVEEFVLTSAGDMTGADGMFSAGFSFSGLDLGVLVTGLLGDLLPTQADFTLSLAKIDVEGFKALLSAAQRSGSISDETVVERDVLAMFPALRAWWNASAMTLSPSLDLQTPLSALILGGDLTLDPASTFGITGTLDARLEGFDTLQARISQAASSSNPQDQQIGASLLLPFGLISGFADVEDDGSLELSLDLDSDGNITVNGLPLPF